MKRFEISGNIVDVIGGTVTPGTVVVADGRVQDVLKRSVSSDCYILPGLIDAHIHIESSMLVPSEFARMAVVHGTVATVSDPHEIANVLGIRGVHYMIRDAQRVPFKIYFGAPSCVPATAFETSGARLEAPALRRLLANEQIRYLSEMMNYPGVIAGDATVMAKIALAKRCGKLIDGHAPELRGDRLKRYVRAGISTDHESFELAEALEKAALGMKVIIREGSAARNFEALHPLIGLHPQSCMFCSDDKHPDDLKQGHIDQMVRRAFKLGYEKMDVLRCATLNPVRHYGLGVGLLRPGDAADFIVVDNLDRFHLLKTYVDGHLVAKDGRSLMPRRVSSALNRFVARRVKSSDFAVDCRGRLVNVIEVSDGEIITKQLRVSPKTDAGRCVADLKRDLLKIAVINRYRRAPCAVGFIKNFGLKKGAIASSVSHDSHNIVVVGTTDSEMARAVNHVMRCRGALALVDGGRYQTLPLPVAGLMSNRGGFWVADRYARLKAMAKRLGSKLSAPFMTLSFMALLVEPEIKLGDRGLFDSKRFCFIDLFDSANRQCNKKDTTPKRFWVYLAQCGRGTYYAGYTTDLEHRLKLHNCGKGAKYLRGRAPVKLVYARAYPSSTEALREEYRLKQLTRAQKAAVIDRSFRGMDRGKPSVNKGGAHGYI